MINPLAQELNSILAGTTPGELLSDLGTRIYFPKGIIAQSGEAKIYGTTANGTIGMTVENGAPVILPAIKEYVPGLTSAELVAYAPTAGSPDLRNSWKKEIIKKNPSLKTKNFSLPIVVPGLTAGISYLADCFVDGTKPLLAADPSWDNYALICEARRNSQFRQFSMFADGHFNLDAFEKAMNKEAESGSIRVLLNFPQNPSGYSPTVDEAKAIVSIIKKIADNGTKVMVWCDDAYFGLNYEADIEKQSLFAHLADLSPNILAVKIDGPTKEDFVWGFRCGFLTFSCKGLTEAQYDALTKKIMGIIRSSVSCSSTPPQSLLLRAFNDPAIEDQKKYFRGVLERRYAIVKNFISTHSSEQLSPLPFNSGYFMSFHLNSIDSNVLREKLLKEKGIGTIAIDSRTLRVAFSSIEEDKIELVYQAIYDTAEEIARA